MAGFIHKITARACGSRPNPTLFAADESLDQPTDSIGVELTYLNEGGANVIYSIVVDMTESGDDAAIDDLRQLLTGKVLRIRKEEGALSEQTKENTGMIRVEDELASSSTFKVYDYFHTRVEPLLPAQFLLQHNLIRVSTKLINDLNAALKQADSSGARPKGRTGSRLDAGDPFALLLENMLPTPGQSVTLELKPKWLSDAPNATGETRSRCRTCALRAMRNAQGKKGHHAGSRTELCPLVWTQGTDEMKAAAAQELLRQQGLPSDPLWEKHKDVVTAALARECTSGSIATLFEHLAGVTAGLDPQGVRIVAADGTEQEREDLALAMTLRDCTLFVNFAWDYEGLPRFKLADLDRKDWRTKMERWRDAEEELISGGWYGDGDKQDVTNGADPEVCLLWR